GREIPAFLAQLDGAFVAAGFEGGSFSRAGEDLSTATALVPEDIGGTPLDAVIAPHFLDVGDQAAVLTFVRGAKVDALESRLASVDGAFLFDQHAMLREAYGGYRTRVLELVALGFVLILAMVILRYRRLTVALLSLLPALAATLGMLGAIAWLGIAGNLMHVIAMLLVLCIGVDYGVFVMEHRDRPRDLGATMLSIFAACLTTALSFGLLAMSTQPAMRSLGLGLAIGVPL